MKRIRVYLALAAALALSIGTAHSAPTVDQAQSQAVTQDQLSKAPASMQAGQVAANARHSDGKVKAKWMTRDGAMKAQTASASTGHIKKIAPATSAQTAKANLDEQFVVRIDPLMQGAANFVIKPQESLQQAAIGDTGGTGFGKSFTIKGDYALRDHQTASKKALIDGTPQQLAGAFDFNKATSTAIS